jgi:tetratricopeptide (TPR) repeat protein
VDALRYGEGLLDLAAHHMPTNDFFRWSILLKLIMSHLGLEQVESAMKLASEEGEPLAAKHAEIRVDLYYLLSMLSSRFTKPRDFKKGEDYLERGLEAIEQAHLPEGERHFKTVFNRNGLAMIRNFQHRHQEAIELCRTGIERLEQHLSGDQHRLHRSILFYNMAQVYAAIGSSDEAIRYYSVAMQMDQNYSEYYNDRGNVYLKLGLLDEAKADYLTAIELSPPYFEVFANLGQCYRRMGQMELAIESYSRALDLEPNHALALLGRAKAQEELGNGPLAINDYSAALKLDPTMWEAFASRAFLLYDTGDLAQSLADLNKAIELKNDSADLYQNRAILLTDLKQFDKALGDLQKAVRLTSNLQDRLTLEEEIEKVAALADFDTIPR